MHGNLAGAFPNGIAIMQPYIFPYIGYFQLAVCSDYFVFFDDVQYIRRGWINRNRLTSNGSDAYFTVPVDKETTRSRICDGRYSLDSKWLDKLERRIDHEYSHAPFFKQVRELFLPPFRKANQGPISELAIQSIVAVMGYLEIEFSYTRSSSEFADSAHLKGAERLIEIIKAHNCRRYLNLPGGKELYDPQTFSRHGIDLKFIEPNCTPYRQFSANFIPNLSIIDVLMHNSPEWVRSQLVSYELV